MTKGLGVLKVGVVSGSLLMASVSIAFTGLAARSAYGAAHTSHESVQAELASAGPNLIMNGSFESPVVTQRACPGPLNGNFGEFFGGSAGITDWTVGGASVDLYTYGNNGCGPAAEDGGQSVDLAGSGPPASGSVGQVVPTVAGQSYELTWWMSGNMYGGGQATKVMNVEWNGASIATSTFDTAGFSASNMGWVEYQRVVVATASSSSISFADVTPDNSNGGAMLDNVSLVDVTLQVASTTLTSAARGQVYAPVVIQAANVQTSTSPFVTTLRWSKGTPVAPATVSLPSGMRLSSTGVLSGTPSSRLAPGTYFVAVKVTETITTKVGTVKTKSKLSATANIPITIG